MNLPGQLIQSLQNNKGFNEEAFQRVHQSGMQVTSIRLNPRKFSDQESELSIEEKVPWSSNGFYLTERPSFTLDPLFHAGAYYVQEASSMFLEEAIRQTVDLSQPIKALDLCAAPGGKSTLMQSILSNESLLVSNEVIKTRVNILAENITKWGGANVVVTNNDAKDFQRLPHFFDLIVVDAPCSGSGLFRKDHAAIAEWSESNVALCSQRQQRILADIMPSLKEGGVLIYSTCSYSKAEDEDIGRWLMTEFQVEQIGLTVDEDWGIVESEPGYRFYPDKVKGEGFYIAAFRKIGSVSAPAGKPHNQKPKAKIEKLAAKEVTVLKPFLESTEGFFFFRQNSEVIAMPAHLANDLASIQASMYIKKAGVKLGTIIRDELIPAHDLAVSTLLGSSVNRLETDLETALQFLRRQEIRIDTGASGWLLLTWQKLPLGWIKKISNRINNYYPSAWRILHK